MKKLINKNPFVMPVAPQLRRWSYSTLKDYRKCKRKFFWKHIMHLRPRKEASPLMVSNVTHQILANWYMRKRVSMSRLAARIIKAVQKELEENTSFYDQDEYDELTIRLESLRSMMEAYVKVYSKDWVVNKEQVERWFELDLGDFTFVGRIDLLPKEGRRQLVVDHKVVSTITDSYIETLPMDGQLRGYLLGARKGLGLKPTAVVYNLLRKCKLKRRSNETVKEFVERAKEDYILRPDFYFYRTDPLMFSKDDVKAFEYDLRNTDQEFALHQGRCSLNAFYDPREWTCSDHMCEEYHRACEYFPLCTQGLDQGTARLYTQYLPKNSSIVSLKG